ncbi:MAG: protoporphyrinogen oxidase [Acidobacteriota bacterium]|nr:MAG: protoporphyrinogen oxidase [Acidobacteriota bacterium]
MKSIVVIGGGISGTAAAWTANRQAREHHQQGDRVEVVLLERENEVGGKAFSVSEDDWMFETGPLGYLNNEPIVDELVDDVGLRDDALEADAAQSRRFVYLDDRLREVRTHPLGFLTSGVLSPRALLRAAREPWVPKKTDGVEVEDDESAWDFAARRLGRDFADRLIHPMCLGIFAGDSKRLSLPASFPLMAELERDHGSLVRAQVSRARARRRGELPPRRSTLCSFRRGMQSLPRALSARGEFATRTSTTVATVRRENGRGWRVVVEGGETIPADAVVLACEGWRAASMLEDVAPTVSSSLREIRYPAVYVVALGYGPEARASIPEGFGVLIPRDAGYRSLGVTCDGYLFPRNSDNRLLVRVLLGGTFDPDIAALDPEEVVALAQGEVTKLYGLSVEPLYRRARLWSKAIPQYELGHGAKVVKIEAELARTPGLYLAGNALYGPAFGKAAARGAACGREAISFLATSRFSTDLSRQR